jgi:hypothetical protein
MSFDRPTAEQRRERFLRLADKARERAAEAPAMRDTFLQIAESWDLMAQSATELGEIRGRSNQMTIYWRVRNWLRQNVGHTCCDECLSYRVGAPRANISAAVRRVGLEHGFTRYSAHCDYCGDIRAVSRASQDAL